MRTDRPAEAGGGGVASGGRGLRVTGISTNANRVPVSGRSAARVTPSFKNGTSAEISENVKIVGAKTPSGKVSLRGGSAQVSNESLRSSNSSARGLRAANKPTNKVGSSADKALRSRTSTVRTSKEEMVKIYDHRYGKGAGEDITQINKQTAPKNEARSVNHQPRIGGHAN